MKVKCLAQEHNTMFPAKAQTRTARSRDEHTNHEVTAPHTRHIWYLKNSPKLSTVFESKSGQFSIFSVEIMSVECSFIIVATLLTHRKTKIVNQSIHHELEF